MRVIDTDALPADPIEALRELSRVDSDLESLRRYRVEAARRAGISWQQIGEAPGVYWWELQESSGRRSAIERPCEPLHCIQQQRLWRQPIRIWQAADWGADARENYAGGRERSLSSISQA